MKSLVVKRSIVIAGHKTSVSLEDAFWGAGRKKRTPSKKHILNRGGKNGGRQQGNRLAFRLLGCSCSNVGSEGSRGCRRNGKPPQNATNETNRHPGAVSEGAPGPGSAVFGRFVAITYGGGGGPPPPNPENPPCQPAVRLVSAPGLEPGTT